MKTSSDNIQTVKVDTLDDFCKSENIGFINYLKIDTEGFDLEVLKGGDLFISNHLVDFIEVESGMNITNQFHVALDELRHFIEQSGYFLYAFY